MNLRTVQLTGIKWFTDSIGNVKPVLTLNKLVRTKDTSFDGVALEDGSLISKRSLTVGEKLKLKVSPDGIKITDAQLIKTKTNVLIQPKTSDCPVCHYETVEVLPFKLVCSNTLCPAKAKTQLYKLGLQADPNASSELVENYFSKFKDTMSEEPYDIASFHHYIFVVRNHLLNVYQTSGRIDCHPDEATYKFECALVDLLRAGLSNKQFWYIIGLRDITEEQLTKLAEVDYRLGYTDVKKFDQQLREQFGNDTSQLVLVRDVLLTIQASNKTLQTLIEIEGSSVKSKV